MLATYMSNKVGIQTKKKEGEVGKWQRGKEKGKEDDRWVLSKNSFIPWLL